MNKITRIRRIGGLVIFWRGRNHQHTYVINSDKNERKIEQMIGKLIINGQCHIRRGSDSRHYFDAYVTKNIQGAK